MLEQLIFICACSVCVGAAWSDLRARRIPNILTIPALVLALGIRAGLGVEALVAGAAGAAVAFALAAPLFALGGFGGGDVKLLAAVGAFLGLDGLPAAVLVMSLVGGVMALWAVVRRGVLGRTLRNLGRLAKGIGFAVLLRDGAVAEAALPKARPDAVMIPYGVPIAAGALVGLLV